ncbi:MAG TPA: Crp/Fnr family transcriptional regulator [Rhizobiaceae bacterium]|nr:Crp/Fnr family transcriptional regulator [Rhizobiaceae bacterium]
MKGGTATRRYECAACPLRRRSIFRDFNEKELSYIGHFKSGELTVDKGATVLVEGTHSPHLYTVLQGWGFRYKLLPDGRRQILNYALPGDLIGLQSAVMDEMQHSVEALSPMLLCVFERDQLDDLYRNYPGLAYDITWLAAREEQMLDENMLSVGRRTALERAAYLIAFLHHRAITIGVDTKGAVTIPITQQHMADTLGLSLVHTNKTIRKLINAKLIRWLDGCQVLEFEKLTQMAGWSPDLHEKRPIL